MNIIEKKLFRYLNVLKTFFKYKGEQRRSKMARNLVDYEAGKTIFATAMGVILKSNIKQSSLFGDGF